MFKTTALMLACAMAVLAASAARAAEPADKAADKEDLSAAIKKGVEMLDAKKITELVSKLEVQNLDKFQFRQVQDVCYIADN